MAADQARADGPVAVSAGLAVVRAAAVLVEVLVDLEAVAGVAVEGDSVVSAAAAAGVAAPQGVGSFKGTGYRVPGTGRRAAVRSKVSESRFRPCEMRC